MDGDPAVEPELDSFSRTLPLPYRIALVIVLGVWAWGANLHYLSYLKIDVPALLRYPSRTPSRVDPPHHLSTYRLATILTIPLVFSILVFWLFSHRSPDLVIYYDFLPITYLVYLLLIFALPIRRFSSSGRFRFLAIFRRISLGGIAQSVDGKFGDILLADVLTSYAKIIADLFVALCMFFSHGGSATKTPDRACGGQYFVPIIIAVPSIIRFRQCMIEYFRVQESNRHHDGSSALGWGGQHLANALKYSTAFPVIIFSALQRNLSLNHSHIGVTEVTLYRLWLLSVLLNSMFSFYWDVAKDWDLEIFSKLSSRSPSLSQNLLRPRLIFPSQNVYYTAIMLDFFLRFTWSLKLSPHLDHFADFESGIFLLEFLEVLRRWGWLFLRIETEWIRNLNSGVPIGVEEGLGMSLLGDFSSGKEDSE